jgi:hypothetical protein
MAVVESHESVILVLCHVSACADGQATTQRRTLTHVYPLHCQPLGLLQVLLIMIQMCETAAGDCILFVQVLLKGHVGDGVEVVGVGQGKV